MYSSTTAVTTYPEIVGCVLTLLRKELKATQSTIAEAVGVGVSTWSRIENGESALTVEQLALAAQALDVTPGLILQLADSLIPVLKNYRGIGIAPCRGVASSNFITLTGSSLAKEIRAVPALDETSVSVGVDLSTKVAELVNSWLLSQKLMPVIKKKHTSITTNNLDDEHHHDPNVVASLGPTATGITAGATAAAVMGGSVATLMSSARAGTTGAALAATAGATTVATTALGGVVGGGVAAGVMIAAAAPVTAVAALGYGLFKLFED